MGDRITQCPCPVNEFGDIRCHGCGQRVNIKCWNCRLPRGEGPCPTTADNYCDRDSCWLEPCHDGECKPGGCARVGRSA